MWQQWVNALLGLWTIVVGFLGLSGSSLTWTLVITGAVIAILGFWGANVEANERTHLHDLETQLRHRIS